MIGFCWSSAFRRSSSHRENRLKAELQRKTARSFQHSSIWSYPYYGSWYYPYYGSDYSPYFDSSYIAPSISDTTTEASNAPAQPTAAINATTPVTDASTGKPSQISDAVSNIARITVRLPDMAELWFDGTMSTATGPVREFTTPSLTPGQKYTYEVRARWLEDDTFRDQTQTISFAPGDKIEVNFPKSPGHQQAEAPGQPVEADIFGRGSLPKRRSGANSLSQ